MAQDLGSFLKRETLCAPGSFVLITEVDLMTSDSVVVQLIGDQLRSGNGVCVLAANHTYQHYQQIASKMGISLRSYDEKGQLVVKELMKDELEGLRNGTCEAADGKVVLPRLANLKTLYLSVKDEIRKCDESGLGYLILIDDLSVWLNMGVEVREIVTFVQYCRTLTCSSPLGCLAAVAYEDSSENDGDDSILLRMLMHFCDSNIRLSPLMSGYSKTIDGELTLIWKNRKLELKQETRAKVHFKVEEKKVLVFPPGISPTIL